MTAQILFYCLAALSVLGGIGIAIISRNQEKDQRDKTWIKFFVYFFVINTMFAVGFCNSMVFRIICISIVVGGGIEILRIQLNMRKMTPILFCSIGILYVFVSLLFCLFGFEDRNTLLFTLFVVCSFDAFSQISGQLFGKRKISPRISQNKTIGGTIGGVIASLVVSFVVGKNMGWKIDRAMFLGFGIALSSFFGDFSASCIKRFYGVKDFSNVFPEHGGFLDRFDSLIFAGAFVYLPQIGYLINNIFG